MSARNIIYDARFKRGTFQGYQAIVPPGRINDVFNTTLIEWSENTEVVRTDVKQWLVDKGPWRQSHGTFYFSRQDAAAQFKLAFC